MRIERKTKDEARIELFLDEKLVSWRLNRRFIPETRERSAKRKRILI